MYFDENGDPATGYNIVTWDWTEGSWSVKIVGEYSSNPPDLTVDISQIYWNTNHRSKVRCCFIVEILYFYKFL